MTLDIESLRAIESRMTKGPWEDDNGYRAYGPIMPRQSPQDFRDEPERRAFLFETKHSDANGHDSTGIVALRNAAPDMLDEIERQAKRIEELEGALKDISDGPQPRDEYHRGVRCGIEDVGYQGNTYAAAEHAYDQGVEWCGDIAHRTLKSKGGEK